MDPIAESIKNQRYVQRLRRLADRLEAENNQFTLMSVQEGQTKTIKGMRYVWQRGKSGKARWHRTDRERKGAPVGHRVATGSEYGNPKAKRFYPQEKERHSSMTVPVYGNEDKIDRELDPGQPSAQHASTYEAALRRTEKNHAVKRVANRKYLQTMIADVDGDGIDERARVGIPGKSVQPPPPLKRVKGLNGKQQVAEAEFITAYETRTAEFIGDAIKIATQEGQSKGGVPIFETDGMKKLAGAHWQGAENRASNNVALHQAANAICKMAFKKHLATLPKGSNVLVTCGGCGAGKGFVLGNNPIAKQHMANAAVIWDSAGDQNATENPWILEEAKKHGHNVTYLYVHADPLTSWADPKRGVVQRAMDPNNGRMVTARVFADSYALGAKNHQAFVESTKGDPSAKFAFFRNGEHPEMMAGIPPEAFHDADQLYEYALGVIDKRHDLPTHVREAATFKFGG